MDHTRPASGFVVTGIFEITFLFVRAKDFIPHQKQQQLDRDPQAAPSTHRADSAFPSMQLPDEKVLCISWPTGTFRCRGEAGG